MANANPKEHKGINVEIKTTREFPSYHGASNSDVRYDIENIIHDYLHQMKLIIGIFEFYMMNDKHWPIFNQMRGNLLNLVEQLHFLADEVYNITLYTDVRDIHITWVSITIWSKITVHMWAMDKFVSLLKKRNQVNFREIETLDNYDVRTVIHNALYNMDIIITDYIYNIFKKSPPVEAIILA